MTEHLHLDERKPSGSEIHLPQPPESYPQIESELKLGAIAAKLTQSFDTIVVVEHSSGFDNPTRTGGQETMTNNQEGVQNAELFKRTYDAVVESIDNALQADMSDIGDKLTAILGNIGALSATPYISSAPEFVAMVEAAKTSVEAAASFSALGSEGVDSVATALSQAKQQLAGTLVAYRPPR